jgi:hypothetical protein
MTNSSQKFAAGRKFEAKKKNEAKKKHEGAPFKPSFGLGGVVDLVFGGCPTFAIFWLTWVC